MVLLTCARLLLTCGPRRTHFRALHLPLSWRLWSARRFFKQAAELDVGARYRLCCGLGPQAAKGAHFRGVNALRSFYPESRFQTCRYKCPGALKH